MYWLQRRKQTIKHADKNQYGYHKLFQNKEQEHKSKSKSKNNKKELQSQTQWRMIEPSVDDVRVLARHSCIGRYPANTASKSHAGGNQVTHAQTLSPSHKVPSASSNGCKKRKSEKSPTRRPASRIATRSGCQTSSSSSSFFSFRSVNIASGSKVRVPSLTPSANSI